MIAYLVLAHNQPGHLQRLTTALDSKFSHTFIHIDRKSDMDAFARAVRAEVQFIPERVKVFWGNWSQLQATLALAKAALAAPEPYSHFALLSGSDYPMRPGEELFAYLNETKCDHIDRVPFPSEAMNKPLSRLSERRIDSVERQVGVRAKLVRGVNRVLAKLPEREVAKILGSIQPFTGSQWWILSRATLIDIYEQFRARTPAVRLFMRSHIPDEMFFQTLITARRTPDIKRGVTFVDWSEGKHSPATLTVERLHALHSTGLRLDNGFGEGPCFFARKFDEADTGAYLLAEAIRLGSSRA